MDCGLEMIAPYEMVYAERLAAYDAQRYNAYFEYEQRYRIGVTVWDATDDAQRAHRPYCDLEMRAVVLGEYSFFPRRTFH